jgi:hypothetical protein
MFGADAGFFPVKDLFSRRNKLLDIIDVFKTRFYSVLAKKTPHIM